MTSKIMKVVSHDVQNIAGSAGERGVIPFAAGIVEILPANRKRNLFANRVHLDGEIIDERGVISSNTRAQVLVIHVQAIVAIVDREIYKILDVLISLSGISQHVRNRAPAIDPGDQGPD